MVQSDCSQWSEYGNGCVGELRSLHAVPNHKQLVQGVNRLDFAGHERRLRPFCVDPTGLRVESRLAELPEAPATSTYYVIFGLLGFTLFRRDLCSKRWNPAQH